MDVFRQWILCIIIAAGAGTIACVLSPRGSADKTVRTVVGIFVVAAICLPFSQLDFEEIILPVYARSYASENHTAETDDYFISVFQSAVEKEILLLASQYETEVNSIRTDASVDANKCIIIHNIQIFIRNNNEINQSYFLKAIEEKLGVSVTLTAE